jgi:uncharacterized protein with HEPN domain
LRDVLDRLERFGVIPSADRWDEIRSMRNQLAHDYPASEAEKAATIELARGMAKEMAAVLDRISQLVAPTSNES